MLDKLILVACCVVGCTKIYMTKLSSWQNQKNCCPGCESYKAKRLSRNIIKNEDNLPW
jgi:hypothetical protein